MKKFLLSLVALLGVMNVSAQTTADVSGAENAIYVQGGVFPIGSEILVPIKIKNSIQAQATSFYVTLQDGLAFAADSGDKTSIACEAPNSDHTIMSNFDTGMIVLYSGKNAYLPETFMILHLNTEGATPGEYTIKIGTINLSNADDESEVWVKDVDFTSTIVLSDGLVLDENAEAFPVISYTGDVTVKRTLKKDKWNTIVLPFAVTKDEFPEIFGEGATAATFNAWTVEYTDEGIPSNITIEFSERKTTLANVLTAGTPYLVKPTKDVSEFTKTSVTVTNDSKKEVVKTFEDEDFTGEVYDGKFIATYAKTKVPQNGLFIRDQKFYYSQGESVIQGFRGYFDLGLILNQDPSAGVKMQIVVDDEATDIEGLQIKNANGAVYSIDGKKIGNNVERLQKGVYIIDGKKVAIK